MFRSAALALCAGALMMATGCMTTTSATVSSFDDGYSSATVGVSVDEFYPALSPYGEWIYVSGIGQVWSPYDYVVGADFVPYSTGGQWVLTDAGWSFVSDFDWGWATFHYGRWMPYHHRWIWVPGTRWAPAWVEWRYGGGYVGWAPLPPPGFRVTYVSPGWTYVETRHFYEPEIHRYRLPPNRYHEATAVTHAGPRYSEGHYHRAGPPPADISRATGRQISMAPARPTPPHGEAFVRPPPGEPSAPGRGPGTPLSGPRRAGPNAWVAPNTRPSRALPAPSRPNEFQRMPPPPNDPPVRSRNFDRALPAPSPAPAPSSAPVFAPQRRGNSQERGRDRDDRREDGPAASPSPAPRIAPARPMMRPSGQVRPAPAGRRARQWR